MSMMKQFPIDTIKIDRSFVRNLPHGSEDKAIAQAIIAMGKALGLTSLPKGSRRSNRVHSCARTHATKFRASCSAKPCRQRI
jgi:predicted signal transduction protein with EAL and GGDEF domain